MVRVRVRVGLGVGIGVRVTVTVGLEVRSERRGEGKERRDPPRRGRGTQPGPGFELLRPSSLGTLACAALAISVAPSPQPHPRPNPNPNPRFEAPGSYPLAQRCGHRGVLLQRRGQARNEACEVWLCEDSCGHRCELRVPPEYGVAQEAVARLGDADAEEEVVAHALGMRDARLDQAWKRVRVQYDVRIVEGRAHAKDSASPPR